MIFEDFHVHTTYCDGKNTPEEMVLAALEIGMEKIGFSCHSYMGFDTSYSIKKERISEYKSEIRGLAEKYKGKIQIFCGVEQDYFSNEPTDGFDYVIGSVHYVKKNGEYLEIDNSREILIDVVKKHYNGDYFAFCSDYFKLLGDVAQKTNADIIGHFDLVTKFNEGDVLFDTFDVRYTKMAKSAIDKLLKYNKPFEINTGAISRGYRSEPYPDKRFIEYIKENGGNLILSSDSHDKESLCGYFDVYEHLLK